MEKELKTVLKWNSKRMLDGEPVLIPIFYGPSGSGKTWRAKALFEELKQEVPDLVWARMLPGTMLPEEVLGLPKVTQTKTVWTAPDWAVGHDPVFLFVDELDKARPETLGGLLTLFAEGRIRDRLLPRGSMILGAMQPVNRAEWLADETGEAIGARLMYIPLQYDWRWLEDHCGLGSGALDFLPSPKKPAPPLTETPSPRQIEYCLAMLSELPEAAEAFLPGILPEQFINPLKEAKGKGVTLTPKALLETLQEKPDLVERLSVAELMAILPESWFTTTSLMTRIYKEVLIRGSADDIKAAQKSIYEYLRAKCDEGGGECEIFPGQDDPEELARDLNEMAREVGQVWMKRGKDNEG